MGRPNSPTCDGERWLVPWLSPLALDGIKQGRLLTAYVGARSPAYLDVEREARAHHVDAQQSGRTGGGDGSGHALGGQRVLASQIEIADLAAGRITSNGHSLDEAEGILLHEEPILEGSGFRLVRVAHEVVRPGGSLGHRVPLPAGGEGGSTAADEFGRNDLLDDRGRPKLDRPCERAVTTAFVVGVKTRGIDCSHPAQQPEAGLSSLGNRPRDHPKPRRRGTRLDTDIHCIAKVGERVEDVPGIVLHRGHSDRTRRGAGGSDEGSRGPFALAETRASHP